MGLFDNFCVMLFQEQLRKKLRNFLKIKIDIYSSLILMQFDAI
jgi:hypothetical protein